MDKEKFALEIFKRYGNVKRARNCFLYTAKNVRLTDLYQEDGRAILGWGGSSAFTMFKNALGRGANGSFFTDYSYRMEKAVSTLLASKRKILFFYKKSVVLEIAKNFFSDSDDFAPAEEFSVKQKICAQTEKFSVNQKIFAQTEDLNVNQRTSVLTEDSNANRQSPAPTEKSSAINQIFYKPWILSEDGKSINWSEKSLVVLEPPLPWSSELYILAVKSENPKITEILENIKTKYKDEIISIPAPMQAAYARSIYNLIQELQERSEKDWFLWDSVLKNYFVRKGPYLFTKIPQNKYDDFVLHCLDLGILINPCFEKMSIVPFGAERGILTCLKKNPFEF